MPEKTEKNLAFAFAAESKAAARNETFALNPDCAFEKKEGLTMGCK